MIETRVIRVDPDQPTPAVLGEAAAAIAAGRVIAFPTDTVYGLAARPDDEAAIAAVYEIKGRPRSLPLVLFLPDAPALEEYAVVTPQIRAAVARFWPGPLTVVARARATAPGGLVSAGTVGFRVPRHPVARGLVATCGALATTSANLSGRGATGDPQEVLTQLAGRITLLLDAGPAPGGVESAVVDFTTQPPTVLRAGAIGVDELRAVIGDVARR